MSKPHPSYSVKECKIKASKLLKLLHSHDISVAQKAAKRLKILPEFKSLSADEIIQQDVKRKHALSVIAIEKEFNSWSELKCQLPMIKGGFLNHWFASYDEAKANQQANGGFLLPYQKQYFICDEAYISNLGFDSSDPDWEKIGYDWACPHDKEAWKRLYIAWNKIQEENNG